MSSGNMFSCFDRTPLVTDRQTDRQTEPPIAYRRAVHVQQAESLNRARQ